MLNQQRRSMSQPEERFSEEERPVEDLTLAMQSASGPISIPEVAQYRPKGNQSWRWLLISLMSCVATCGAAVGAFVWLINLPPTADCENAASITTDRAQLYCAQIAAESGNVDDILASLDLVGSWTSSHPLYYEVQPLVERWSWVALQEAQQKLNDSDLDGAIALIDYIPPSSPVYETAQDSLNAWNAEWEQGDAIWQKAQAALEVQNWDIASQQITALAELRNRHWRVTQVQELSRQIRQERLARRQLSTAVEVASGGGPANLGSALKTTSRINDTTYAYQDAQPYMDRWSDWLLNLGLDKWYASELNQAIALGQDAAHNPKRAKAAQELIWLSRSRQLAQQSVGTWRTSPDQLMQLYRAMLVANQIPDDSPYYPQAQSSVTTWRTHLKELGKLQIAQAAGQVQNLETLQIAIDQAAQVPLGHPRRLQAQTLIAHWRQEVERLEDRPYLVKAHQLADAETIDGLQQAIATASQVPINRALRNEAQSWIYVWQNKIQELEDRPMLTAAQQLAAAGNYSQAIAKASNIKAGRALFDEAQGAIAAWQREIYAIERARQRALQRAAARRRAASEALREQTPSDSAVTPDGGDGLPQPETDRLRPLPQPIAPAPVQALPQRNPLPQRIETVPGRAPAPEPLAPRLPSSDRAPSLEPPPNSPVPAPAGDLTPSPQPVTPPAVEPAPVVRPEPVTLPNLQVPIPAAPTPQLPVAPSAAPQPQSDATTPKPATATDAPEAAAPVAPSVSAAPAPEQTVSVKTTKDASVLYTGALYAGR